MNEHAGPACALSGLIVGLFAVLLHDKTPAPAVAKPPERNPAATAPLELVPPQISPLPIDPPRARPPIPPPTRPGPPAPVPAPVAPRRTSPGLQPPRAATTAPTVPPAAPGPRRSAFATVVAGESLADVARRVYGSIEAAETLWKANRDQLARVDSPISGGTLLRTP